MDKELVVMQFLEIKGSSKCFIYLCILPSILSILAIDFQTYTILFSVATIVRNNSYLRTFRQKRITKSGIGLLIGIVNT